MAVRSSLLRRDGFSSTASGMPILPTSWSRPPHWRLSRSASDTPISWPISIAIVETFSECFLVDGSRASIADASALIVCVNIFRISTTDWYAARVV